MRWTVALLALTLLGPAAAPVALGQAQDSAPAALVVQGDAELDAEHGVTSGSGTASDPFVLDDLMGRGRLEDRETTRHLVVRGITLGQRSFEFLGDAILLHDVRNVTVEDADVRSYRTGVQAVDSSGVTIRDSSFASQVYHAIAAAGGSDLAVSRVAINGTQGGGIVAQDVDGLTIEGSTLERAGRTENTLSSAIRIERGQDAVVRNTTVVGGRASGIHLHEVDGYELSGNTVTDQGGHGIWINQSLDGVVQDNAVDGVDDNGLYLCHGGSSVVRRNAFTDSGIGADLTDLSFVLFTNNTFDGSRFHDLNIIRANDNRFDGNAFASEPAPRPVVRIEGDRNEFAGNSIAGDPSYWLVAGEGNTVDGQGLQARGEVPEGDGDDEDPADEGIPGLAAPLLGLAVLGAALAVARRGGGRP